jgi:hypothetical protein
LIGEESSAGGDVGGAIGEEGAAADDAFAFDRFERWVNFGSPGSEGQCAETASNAVGIHYG